MKLLRLLCTILLTISSSLSYAGGDDIAGTPSVADYPIQPDCDNHSIDYTRIPATYVDYEKTEGPYRVNGKSFTIFLKMKRIACSSDPFDKNVEYLEIRDETGEVHYSESNPINIMNPLYISIDAYALEGERGEGLVLSYWEWPSGPGHGHDVKLFTTYEGRLVELSGKINVIRGIHDSLKKGSNPSSVRLFDGDTLAYKIHNNYFTITIPLKVPLNTSGRVVPVKWEGIFEIEAHGYPITEETCAKLYTHHDASSPSKAVIFGPQTKIQYIHAYTKIDSEEFTITIDKNRAGFSMDIRIFDTWLKVKIDDIEGWVKGKKHFEAIGLPMFG
ncbi:hypothetical protein [Candidatus Magnetominusculus xianensis]|uniref:Secreted protein n=1 Tax=Candidatus Magnetominusculus xianensis TaxID=1748249 RepID=A0ABR5SHE5_9BACT|nr:hypothetical protein [Candidatus Magnetominusculus xianensis]KWT86942.1 hypothetical protein ASN18_1414 [Candidatus Magnetominusculus xianensis]MBF0403934.1 hypothetical protein [Nitrospirota bacterium]